MSTGRLRIVVSGMLAGTPGHGGATWAVLQYVLGLRALGHDVTFVEPVAADSDAVEPGSASARYFADVTRRFGLAADAAMLRRGTAETAGIGHDELTRRCAAADLLLDVSGLMAREEMTAGIPRRAYVDLDPAFNQLWHAVEGIDVGLGGHTHHVTVGLSIGEADCPVPTCGVEWITTLQPVVLADWPAADGIAHDALTTIANWRGYGSILHDGVHYGQKVHSLRALMGLPARSAEDLLLALAIHPGETDDLAALDRHGWRLVDPQAVAATPDAYRAFVAGSKGELGVAKSGYVNARCGWFSDRSACYLASGRPVVAQDTGFSRHLPVGEGLLAFATEDEAVAAIASLHADYARHARAARAIAEEHFDSARVLGRLLERLA